MSDERTRDLSRITGLALPDCARALALAETPDLAGDVVLALAYLVEAGDPVITQDDRHRAVLGKAQPIAVTLRARLTRLNAAFPKPEPAADRER